MPCARERGEERSEGTGGGPSMVKMSLDPVQVMSGQVKELKVAPSSNGESRGSWEAKEEFDQDHLGLTTKPKPVSVTHTS